MTSQSSPAASRSPLHPLRPHQSTASHPQPRTKHSYEKKAITNDQATLLATLAAETRSSRTHTLTNSSRPENRSPENCLQKRFFLPTSQRTYSDHVMQNVNVSSMLSNPAYCNRRPAFSDRRQLFHSRYPSLSHLQLSCIITYA